MTKPSLPLYYEQPKVLQPVRHAHQSLAEDADYRFSANSNSVPLVMAEFTAACRHFPVVFTDEDVPQPVALLGLRQGQNLFVDEQGQWQAGSYVPAYVRRYPFIFLEDEARSQFTLCIDEAADALKEGRNNPLFDASGLPTPLTKSALAFCRDYQALHEPTQEFTRSLSAAGVLVDHRADIQMNGGQSLSLSGFKVIDEAKFNAIPDAKFRRWRANGWLAPIYAHFVSMGAWASLVDRMALSH